MTARLSFPNKETMHDYLSNHALLNTEYFQQKGITQAIVELATERFADSRKPAQGMKMGAMLIVNDLQRGKDGFSGKDLPNLGKLQLSDIIWKQISMSIELALIDCGNMTKL